MSYSENITNLIPPVPREVRKAKMYRSKKAPPPTGSTFGLHGSTRLAGGDLGTAPSAAKRRTQQIKSGRKDPKNFTKRGAAPAAAAPKKFVRPGGSRKAAVPKASDRPVMGLVTTKNFITANAVENILAQPKNVRGAAVDYRSKADFGKVPAYLAQVKAEVQMEEDFIRSMNQREPAAHAGDEGLLMDDAEREDLVDQLKTKWDETNKIYQLHLNVDSIGSKRRKENLERELKEIESNIELLSKPVMIRG